MTIILLVLVIFYLVYLHNKVSKLSGQLTQLKTFLSTQKNQAGSTGSDQSSSIKNHYQEGHLGVAPAQHISQPSGVPQEVLQSRASHHDTVSEVGVIAWLKRDWLLKVGAFLVLLSMGWFVNYAFAQNWIGPMGRISLGMVAGLAVLVIGQWRSQSHHDQGTVLLGLGSAIILTTTFAGRQVYDFFTPSLALGMMFMVACFVAFSSVRAKVVSRAHLGLIIACIAPFLTVSVSPSISTLFLYLFVVVAGTVWVVTLTGWRSLLAVAVAVYGLYSWMGVFGNGMSTLYIPQGEIPTMRIIITAFVVLFYGVGLISAVRSAQVKPSDVFIKVVSAVLFLGWIQTLIPEHWQSIVLVSASFITAVGAYGIRLKVNNKWLVVLHAGLSLSYLAMAISLELSGPTALLAYIGLLALAVWLIAQLSDNYKVAQLIGAPFIILTIRIMDNLTSRNYARFDYDAYSQTGHAGLEPVVLYSELFVTAVMAMTLLGLGAYFYQVVARRIHAVPPKPLFTTLYLLAGLFHILLLVWFGLSKVITNQDVANASALVVMSLIGVGCYLYGRLEHHKKTMYTGGMVVVFVVFRLLLVEVWSMDIVERVLLFLVVGGMLMSTAFIKPRTKKEIP